MPLLPSIINNFSVDVLLHYMGKKIHCTNALQILEVLD